MRRSEVASGMLLYAYTSLWGEFLVKVTKITEDRPARVYGIIMKILKEGYGFRADVPMLGREIDVGIINVKEPTPEQLAGLIKNA